jgi:hypothetical protein
MAAVAAVREWLAGAAAWLVWFVETAVEVVAITALVTVVGFVLVVVIGSLLGVEPMKRSGPKQDWAALRWQHHGLLIGVEVMQRNAASMLSHIALTDPTVPATATFLEKFRLVERLGSEQYISEDHNQRFGAALVEAEAAWDAATREAGRIGLSRLEQPHRAAVQELIDVLRPAVREPDEESPEAIRACAELAELESAGVLRLPERTWRMLRFDAEGGFVG